MPLTNKQIEKLSKIPNRVKIFGEATPLQKSLIQNDNRITPTDAQYAEDAKGNASGFNLGSQYINVSNFLKENYGEFENAPLSVFMNDLMEPGNKLKRTRPWDLNSTFFNSLGDFGKIGGNRVIAGFVTSGTGVLTDRYALDTEVCWIEDETGGIGIVFQNDLNRGFYGTDLKYSFGRSTVKPLILGADGSSSNVLQNDHRHNLRVGDLIIIQSGELMYGAGYGNERYDGYSQPTFLRYISQGPMIIHKVSEYTVDTELRGAPPIPWGMGNSIDEKIFRGDFGNQGFSKRVSKIDGNNYAWKKQIFDSRLVVLKDKWKIMNVDVFSFPSDGAFGYDFKGPLYGKNLVFKPNSIYYLESEDGFHRVKMCISATTEIAKFAVKMPSSISRPSAIGGSSSIPYLENITGILIQDTESDERIIFPRFYSDLYPIYDDEQR